MQSQLQPVHIEPEWQQDLSKQAENIPERQEKLSTVSVFGLSGTGKSLLINHLLRKEAVPVHDNTEKDLETVQEDIQVDYKQKFKLFEVAHAPKVKQVSADGQIESGEKVKDFLKHSGVLERDAAIYVTTEDGGDLGKKVIEEVSESNVVMLLVCSCSSEAGVDRDALAKDLGLKEHPDVSLFQVFLPWYSGNEESIESRIDQNLKLLDFSSLERFLESREGFSGLIYLQKYITAKLDEAVMPLTEAGFKKRVIEFGASAGMSVLIPIIGPPAYTFLRMMKRAVEMCVAAGLFSEHAGHAFIDEVTALLKKGVWRKGEQPMMEAI